MGPTAMKPGEPTPFAEEAGVPRGESAIATENAGEARETGEVRTTTKGREGANPAENTGGFPVIKAVIPTTGKAIGKMAGKAAGQAVGKVADKATGEDIDKMAAKATGKATGETADEPSPGSGKTPPTLIVSHRNGEVIHNLWNPLPHQSTAREDRNGTVPLGRAGTTCAGVVVSGAMGAAF
jgi:hypothetical protein